MECNSLDSTLHVVPKWHVCRSSRFVSDGSLSGTPVGFVSALGGQSRQLTFYWFRCICGCFKAESGGVKVPARAWSP